jgi:hypothetical protein
MASINCARNSNFLKVPENQTGRHPPGLPDVKAPDGRGFHVCNPGLIERPDDRPGRP